MSFSFSTLFKPTLSKSLNIAKILDDKVEKFVEKLASQLDLEITTVRNAVACAITVFEDDEQKLKQTELEMKKLEREKLKAIRDEKKRIENEEKEIKKLEREQLKAERDERKRVENEEKEKIKLQKEEEKKMKNEKQPVLKQEKQIIVCDADDCESRPKSPKIINGKNYCSKCYRKIEKQINEANKVKCAHIGKKDKQCSSSANRDGYCSRHVKKNESQVSIQDETNVLNDFNFETEQAHDYEDDNDKFWDNVKKASIKQYGSVEMHKICNVIFKQDKQVIGIFNTKSSSVIPEKDLSLTIKKWIANCGLYVPSLPVDDESEISFDENDEVEDIELTD
jgi:hypothetical protein